MAEIANTDLLQKQAEEEKKKQEELQTLITDLDAYGELEKMHSDALASYRKRREAYADSSETYHQMNRLYMDGQVGILAETLKEGIPCPVCGSTSHPSPPNFRQRSQLKMN